MKIRKLRKTDYIYFNTEKKSIFFLDKDRNTICPIPFESHDLILPRITLNDESECLDIARVIAFTHGFKVGKAIKCQNPNYFEFSFC